MKKRIAFYTLGCKLNYSETSSISGMFDTDIYEPVDFGSFADIYVINTCIVTAAAEKKCRTAIRQAIRRNQDAVVAVIGCFSQMAPENIANIQGVDLVIGSSDKFRLPEILEYFVKNSKPKIITSEILEDKTFYHSFSSGGRTRTFLKIQNGCDYFCSYCTIPYARGRSRSDTIEKTIETVYKAVEKGVNEIVLTGVNIGDFGRKNNESLFDLLFELEKIEKIKRLRISSIEPNLLTDEIIALTLASKKILPHFHLPLQAASDNVLKLMRRKYDLALFDNRIRKIKEAMPFACVATDIIAGFPGEKENDFVDACNYLSNSLLSYIHVFSYSERPGTFSSRMADKVPVKIIKHRSEELHKISESLLKNFYNQNIGRKEEVLFEAEVTDGKIFGFTRNYIRVKTNFTPDLVNKIVEVELKKIDTDGVFVV